MIRTSRVAFLATALVAGSSALTSGCSSAGSGAPAAQDSERAGEIGLDLTVAGVTLNSASYVITGPGGYTKSGAIDLSNSTSLSAVIGGIPVGTGYSISITASAADGSTSCAGSGSFNVAAHTTTPVTVNLTCHQASRTGSVLINGTLNVCPVVDGVSANPSEVLLGSSVALSVSAHDADSGPSALAYHWSASSGTFSDASSATPSFKCVAPGSVTLTVTASDGDPAPSCADSSAVQIKCSLPGAGNTAASTVAVYGDAPYGTTPTDTAENLATPAFIASVNADPDVSLVLHVGDIHSGKQFCTQAYDQLVFDLWKSYQDPVVYTPGDNEWADCNKAGEGGGAYNSSTGMIDFVQSGGVPVDYANGDPLANLALIRSMFFAQPGMTLGGQKQVLSQAQFFDPAHPSDAKFVENVMFEQSKVLIVTINLPGGSNDDADVWYAAPTATAAQLQEVVERDGADLRWLDTAFTLAQANGDVAVLISTQADMWDPANTVAHLANFEPYVRSVATHTLAFGKPVLMFSGDSHVYQSENPLSASDPLAFLHPGYDVPNFHRVIVHGSTFPLEWLKLKVDPAVNAPEGGLNSVSFGPFSWTRQIQP